ncbi:hypothetical protein TRAPUB_6095 [Trametes pubescens]|uniref:Uncharacterized protein n=1 Tax=Trametes pubescens TaxID=154538 RepID=A0A1M2V6Z6_TRAPU|nr:hypothetical protein TRAPUB_6095 [Trametes pubescens]
MAIATFAIDEAYLVGDWLESFMWGVYTIMFSMTMYTIYQKRREGVNKFTTTTLILLYVLATGHISLSLTRLIQGFIKLRNVMDPVEYFASIFIRLNMAKDYLYITNLFLGDLIIVWRLYVVYGKNVYIAALPVLMCLGELAVGYASISSWLAPKQNFTVMSRLGSAMFIMSLVVNILLTLIIVARIWIVTRRSRKALGVSGGQYTRVLLLLIESGAFVAAAKLTEFILYELAPVDGLEGMNAIEVVFECMPQITGLAPTCIIFAINKGYTKPDSDYSTKPKSSVVFFSPDGTAAARGTETSMFTSGGAGGSTTFVRQDDSEKGSSEKLKESPTASMV